MNCLQITVGKASKKKVKKTVDVNPPIEQAKPVRSNDCCEGDFVALRLSKYEDEIPQIGRVVAVDEMNVTIEWWIGSYRTTWICWKKNSGEPIKETVPKNAVIYKVNFTKSMRITTRLKNDLEYIYENTELI